MDANKRTLEEIETIFDELHSAAADDSIEATRGPSNPFGTVYDDLVWNGTIEECWKEEKWAALAEKVNDDHDLDITWDDWEEHQPEIEAAALALAESVIGTGRPIYVAFADGTYPTVFCEAADSAEVRRAAEQFFGEDECFEEEETR